jgi:hypothetical protein
MDQPMLTPEQLSDLRYSNALEVWPYFDTVLISQWVAQAGNERFAKAGFLAGYNALGVQGQIPFFKTRNRGTVGLPYCNMDVIDRFNLPFHCFGIAVAFVAPTLSASGDPNPQAQDAFFAAELPKHCGFTFNVGQDEKLASHAGYLNAGSGLVGHQTQSGGTTFGSQLLTQSYAAGRAEKWNIYPFVQVKENGEKIPTPIQIPRNETIQAILHISPEGKNLLSVLPGPGITTGEGGSFFQRALIRVSLYGVREVQLRNLQHY